MTKVGSQLDADTRRHECMCIALQRPRLRGSAAAAYMNRCHRELSYVEPDIRKVLFFLVLARANRITVGWETAVERHPDQTTHAHRPRRRAGGALFRAFVAQRRPEYRRDILRARHWRSRVVKRAGLRGRPLSDDGGSRRVSEAPGLVLWCCLRCWTARWRRT